MSTRTDVGQHPQDCGALSADASTNPWRVVTLAVPEGTEPAHLHRMVARLFDDVPTPANARKRAQRGEILLNGARVSGVPLTRPGDVIALRLRTAPERKVYALALVITYQDPWLAVVVKPQGLATSGNFHRTLGAALPHNLPTSTARNALVAPHPVHRLDAHTGGLIVVARTAEAEINLGRAFEAREVKKRYQAIVSGRLEGAGFIDEPIEERAAITRYVATAHSPCAEQGWLTRVDLWPETGRTHQLRRHLLGLGHPIVGDRKYGPPQQAASSMYLWAAALSLDHPMTGERLHVHAPPPQSFDRLMRSAARDYSEASAKSEATPVIAPV